DGEPVKVPALIGRARMSSLARLADGQHGAHSHPPCRHAHISNTVIPGALKARAGNQYGGHPAELATLRSTYGSPGPGSASPEDDNVWASDDIRSKLSASLAHKGEGNISSLHETVAVLEIG